MEGRNSCLHLLIAGSARRPASWHLQHLVGGTNPNASDIVAIHDRLYESEIVVLLGFAFHRLNLDLLRPADKPPRNLPPIKYFATAFEISDNDCRIIESELRGLLPSVLVTQLELRNGLKCSGLFKEYWRSLSST